VVWSSLGTITPDFELQYFAPAVVGDRVIRVTQSYVGSEVTDINKLYLWERYPSGDLRYLRKLYPSTTPRLIPLTIPQVMKEAGFLEREIGVKHGWAGVVLEAAWTLNLSIYTAPVGAAVDWRVTEVWDGGFAAEVMIHNSGVDPLTDWSVSFGATGITETWGAELLDNEDGSYEATPSITAGTDVIYPGETAIFGFQASGSPALLNLTLN
jgi:hypothetical protein